MQSHKQNKHVFADGRKDINDIFNNHVCSASHMHEGLHLQNVLCETCTRYHCTTISQSLRYCLKLDQMLNLQKTPNHNPLS